MCGIRKYKHLYIKNITCCYFSLQEAYFSNAFTNILPWCMAHHFQTRIYSQAALVKLWNQVTDLDLHKLHKQHVILQSLVDFNQENW